MAILSKEAFMERVNGFIGENNSEDAIAFLTDMSDTYSDLETKSNDHTYEDKYNKLAKQYRDRFMNQTKEEPTDNSGSDERAETITFEDLFKGVN